MILRTMASCLLIGGLLSSGAAAQSADSSDSRLHIELNMVSDVEAACRLTFVAQNTTERDIDQAIFETVVFDRSGGVVTLSLFDFRDVPRDTPRVRQFDVQGMTCAGVGRVLINGINTCTVEGEKSGVCKTSLSLSSRIPVELLG